MFRTAAAGRVQAAEARGLATADAAGQGAGAPAAHGAVRCALSDELQFDEELALDFVARVTERQHRRDLAGMTGRAEAFDDDIGGAAPIVLF